MDELIALAHGPRPLPSTARRNSKRPLVFTAAALAIAACLALVLFPNLPTRLSADFATSTAEIRNVTLPDGSKVTLAPDSAIDVAFEDGQRRVQLRAGRAFFEVAHDPGHPFVVSARRLETTVIGTAFDLRLAERDVEVTVQEGVVRVEDRAATPPLDEEMHAGDWMQIDGNGAIILAKQSPAQVAAWRKSQLIAIDRPVGDVVDELRAYFPGRIYVNDLELPHKRVTGVYDLHDPLAALRAIATAHGAKVSTLTDWILILSQD